MTRQLVSLHAPDISALAKSLKTQLDARPPTPSRALAIPSC